MVGLVSVIASGWVAGCSLPGCGLGFRLLNVLVLVVGNFIAHTPGGIDKGLGAINFSDLFS